MHLIDGVQQRLGQRAIADGAVVAFDLGVLLRLARLDVAQVYTVVGVMRWFNSSSRWIR